MDTTMYNTVPADEPLVQTKAAPTSIKKLIFAVAVTVFVLGAAYATFVAPKSTIVHRVLTEENLDVINGTYKHSYQYECPDGEKCCGRGSLCCKWAPKPGNCMFAYGCPIPHRC